MHSRLGTMVRLFGRCLPVIAWALICAPTASADAGPHMAAANTGATTLTADTCAGCHRAHTAAGEGLIRTPDSVSLCFTCHGSPSVGATTDVVDGILAASNSGLKGGGFTNALMDTSWGAPPVSRPTTSTHVHDGTTSATMWGNGAIGSGVGPTVTLDCTSCHNPHGNTQYRILRPIPTDSSAPSGVAVADVSPKVYTVASGSNRYFGEVYFGADLLAQFTLEQWCTACHSRYSAPAPGAGHTPSGDPIYAFRHRTGFNLPGTDCTLCHNGTGPRNLFDISDDTAHVTTCQNCHVAHGTAATMGTFSGAIPEPNHGTAAPGDSRSSLLRLDNRGLCVACHDPTQ